MNPSRRGNSDISILYVEDDSMARGFLSKAIAVKYPAMKVYTAENGETGLKLFKKHKPDIILTDISMPVMDGIRMAREIKALKSDANIIVITAHSETHYLLDTIKIGLLRYVLKPIDVELLFEAIDDCLVRINLERQVEKQNEHIRKLSSAVEQGPSSIVISDARGTIEYVNTKFTELTGYSQEEVMGQNPRILKTGNTPAELYRQLWSTITSGSEWHGEFLNRKKNGDFYWETASIAPLFNEKGRITHFVAVKEDITERKRMEENVEMLNRRLTGRAAELEDSNEELEAFNYTVSHDLRGPLTIINGYCQIMKQLCNDKIRPECKEYIGEINQVTRKMGKLIDTLLKFSRLGRSKLHLDEVDLSEIAKAFGVELKIRWPQRQVTFIVADGLSVDGDSKLLRIALANLLDNAWKYSARRKIAVIEFGRTLVDGMPTFYVRDNGVGFSREQADKLFTPFIRLHNDEEFEGNGIGLATVQRIVKRHGGKVWAEAKKGKGATFYFTINPMGTVATETRKH